MLGKGSVKDNLRNSMILEDKPQTELGHQTDLSEDLYQAYIDTFSIINLTKEYSTSITLASI